MKILEYFKKKVDVKSQNFIPQYQEGTGFSLTLMGGHNSNKELTPEMIDYITNNTSIVNICVDKLIGVASSVDIIGGDLYGNATESFRDIWERSISDRLLYGYTIIYKHIIKGVVQSVHCINPADVEIEIDTERDFFRAVDLSGVVKSIKWIPFNYELPLNNVMFIYDGHKRQNIVEGVSRLRGVLPSVDILGLTTNLRKNSLDRGGSFMIISPNSTGDNSFNFSKDIKKAIESDFASKGTLDGKSSIMVSEKPVNVQHLVYDLKGLEITEVKNQMERDVLAQYGLTYDIVYGGAKYENYKVETEILLDTFVGPLAISDGLDFSTFLGSGITFKVNKPTDGNIQPF